MKKSLIFAGLAGAAVMTAAASAHGGKGERGDHFARFDKDGDGKVAVSEIDARHKDFIARADADADGFITRDEMKAMHEARREERMARHFPDANNDGKVTRREFEDAARDRFAELDKNGDGLITKEEMADRRGAWKKGG